MTYPNSAVQVWFSREQDKDAEYLRLWRDAPVTYVPDQQPLDYHWSADRYEVILGQDASGNMFRRAAALVLNNRFYPSSVMDVVGDYSLEGRTVRPGDRVLQRVRVMWLNGWNILDVLTMNEVTEVIEEPRRVGFTYHTTAAHSELGEWSPSVEWRENGEVVLLIEVVSRTRPGASALIRRFVRRMQLRAHKLCIENFRAQLHGTPLPAAETSNIPAFVVSGILAAALLTVILVVLRMRRSK